MPLGYRMAMNRPTASLTGQQDWEWNRRQAEQQCRTSDASPQRPHNNRSPREPVTPSRDVEEVEFELKQKDRRLQRVIERYEYLLAKKNQQLAEEASSSTLSDIKNALRGLRRK